MAIFIPYRCSKCVESVMLIQPQRRGGAFKGPAKVHCLNCMDEQEVDLTVPINSKMENIRIARDHIEQENIMEI
jgi:hypothetical protein